MAPETPQTLQPSPLTYLSVCSGIEAATVAWHDLGWQPVGFSEIEPFPSAVLAHHYPNVPNFGDMSALPARILSGEVVAPDILCGGTPCQAFSVAGLRQSLSDDRGNLSLTFCEIANAIDTIRARRCESAGIVFWENVPGVLNTADNAFGCFLGAIAGEDGALEPPRGRWKNAGCVFGPQRAVAWRVLDAQYFGVAQRRRRVFVIASARDGFNPLEVLFEFDGVRRDLAPSREAGEKVAPCVTNGPPFSRTGNERVECEAIVPVGNVQGGDVTTLSSREYKGLSCGRDGMTSAAVIHTAPIALQDVSGRDKAQNGKGWSDTAGPQGAGINEEICFTQNATDVHGVGTYPVGCFKGGAGSAAGGIGYSETLSPTITAADSGSNRTPVIHQQMQVRRLTVTECERLQGFPDGYTAIPWRKKAAEDCPDGPRYKALGNSWAVPVVKWLGSRIETQC